MNSNNNYSELYKDVRKNIDSALTDLGQIKIKNEKGNNHLERLKNKLKDIQANFDKDITFLEKHSEWDKFTIAFFGETSAGKSTILEALRIIFNEKKRQKMIQQNQISAQALEKSFAENSDALIQELDVLYNSYKSQTETIAHQVADLRAIYQKENDLKKKVFIYALIALISFAIGFLASNILRY